MNPDPCFGDVPAARIFRLNEERADLVREVVARLLQETGEQEGSIELAVNDVAFHELARLESEGTSSPAYRQWKELYRGLGRKTAEEKGAILRRLSEGFAQDIVGNFDPGVYRFATSIIPRGLSLLFRNRSLSRGPRALELERRISVQGRVDSLRRLVRRGTVVLVPTHSSNLDSIVVGFALDRLGLPPFTYGAGKNLFSNRLVGYFMHNLGAYKVDRRLKNQLYLRTLKTYSTVILERGYHSLFFPGGTRSRSGGIEQKLKLGLLGTGLVAYQNNLRAQVAQPNIYIVPMTINYPLVLEGASQIDDHLKAVGKSRYIIEDDEFSQLGRIFAYGRSVLDFDGQMFLHIGQALDPFGNPVSDEGVSLDPHGRPIDLLKYLTLNGQLRVHPVRDAEYTRECGEAIQVAYMRNNVALATHVVAYTVFQMLQAIHPGFDIYRLVRLSEDTALPRHRVLQALERVRDALLELAARGGIQLSPAVLGEPVETVLAIAERYFRMYHTRPLVEAEAESLLLRDVKLLFYYHNRLKGYGLETCFQGSHSGGP
ncbi:MAG: 1-acyl-sn-glycerol-3-phosphate acyltransferase [Candidatus Sericytochromatia bacterium]|nr:1-acyl-sn-glycerol-3-phosphate acyltransferase [Candidatus Sericytochromatia bacterium]